MTVSTRKEFDHSMMAAFQQCRRKFEYRYVRHLDLTKPQMAPAFGTAIHKGLDHWYNTRSVPESIDIFKGHFKEDVEVDNKRTHKVGEWILTNYDKTYKDQPQKLVCSEMPFEVPLPNGNTFIGRIDKIVEWDGCLWVVDHKTTSELGAQFAKTTEPAGQFTGYVWAARQLGYKAVGVIVDAILVAKGLLEASSRAKLTPLARFDAYRNGEQIDEWLQNVLKQQRDIKECEDGQFYPMDGIFNGLCTYYGECPYRRVCIESPQVRERLLKADYVEHKWDPRGTGV